MPLRKRKFLAPSKEGSIITGDALTALDQVKDKSVQLVVTSPPYNIGKEYEKDSQMNLSQYVEWLTPIINKLCSKIDDEGSICWQIGNYVKNGEVFPLDYYFYDIFIKNGLKLRNRIVWRYNFGLNATKRLSGRYETILWFTKTDSYRFNIDPIRIPQLYPGKRHSKQKGEKAGLPSGNPKGKNPSDFWEFSSETFFREELVWPIPNVKSSHAEKTIHPCQFPSELAERCILAFTNSGDSVLDPFVGAGTTVIAATIHGRKSLGIDKSREYSAIARSRLDELKKGTLKTRPIGTLIRQPNSKEKVSKIPEEWIRPEEKQKSI
jgi:DNA modification methylase